MSSETIYAGALGDLRRLDAALEANLAEIPHLQGARERIQLLLTGAHECGGLERRRHNVPDSGSGCFRG